LTSALRMSDRAYRKDVATQPLFLPLFLGRVDRKNNPHKLCRPLCYLQPASYHSLSGK
jgi:hypothetical protein